MNIEDSIKTLKEFNKIKINSYAMQFVNISYPDLQEAIETLLTAYEKEKGENVKLRLQDIPLIEGELKAYKDRVNELKQELEKEKEKNKEYKDMIISHKKQLKQSGIYGYDYDLKILEEE